MCPNCLKNLTFKNSFISLSVFGLLFLTANAFASGTNGKMEHSKMDHSKMNHTKPNDSNRKVIDGDTKKRSLKCIES